MNKILTLLIMFSSLFALEKDYQIKLCNQLNGTIEYRLPDGSRVDCLTDKYAIEVDYSKKWKEAIGQALFYGIHTGRKPAIAIITNGKDEVNLRRLESVTEKYDIKLFYIKE